MKDIDYFKKQLDSIIEEAEKEEANAEKQSNAALSDTSMYYYLGCNSALTGILGPLKRLQTELLKNK